MKLSYCSLPTKKTQNKSFFLILGREIASSIAEDKKAPLSDYRMDALEDKIG